MARFITRNKTELSEIFDVTKNKLVRDVNVGGALQLHVSKQTDRQTDGQTNGQPTIR